jgi:DNA-binding NarL/FixJ family response regulator
MTKYKSELQIFSNITPTGYCLSKLFLFYLDMKIAIAEDNPIIRKQYLERFEFFPQIEVVLLAENGKELLENLEKINPGNLPEIILMDIEMPIMDGIEATKKVKEAYPEIEIIMLTIFKDEENIFNAVKAGAMGYLLKDISTEELTAAIEELLNGGAPLSSSIARKVLHYLRSENESPKSDENFNLTQREIEILEAIVRDDTEYAISQDLNISQHTVRTHVKNIYKKLQVHSRGAVVKKAIEHNLLDNLKKRFKK